MSGKRVWSRSFSSPWLRIGERSGARGGASLALAPPGSDAGGVIVSPLSSPRGELVVAMVTASLTEGDFLRVKPTYLL